MEALKPEDLNGPDPMDAALESIGITHAYLARKLKRELNAKKSERIKVKGAVDPGKVGQGRKIVATSGFLFYGKEGGVYGDGNSVIEWKEVDWKIRQTARMDAQKLMGLYPAEKREHSGHVSVAMQTEFSEETERAVIEFLELAKKDIIRRSLDATDPE